MCPVDSKEVANLPEVDFLQSSRPQVVHFQVHRELSKARQGRRMVLVLSQVRVGEDETVVDRLVLEARSLPDI
jgi:ribosomal protein L4